VRLLSRDALKIALARAEARLDCEVDLVLVGGGALLVLSPEAAATRDLDALPTERFDALRKALAESSDPAEPIDLNTASAAFETLLPGDWEARVRASREFSTAHIRVLTPSPEDLAVMKLFRFAAKDAEDIARLAALSGFDRDVFLTRFREVLPTAIGDLHWHAQSFAMIWNRLYPDRRFETEDILVERKRSVKQERKS